MLNYTRTGDGPQTLLLIHGLLGGPVTWQDVVPLVEPHFTTIVVELPGVGQSPYDEQITTISDFADAMVEVLDAEGIDQAIWVGHSLGGYVTSAALRDHSDRISHAVLAYSTPVPDSAEKKVSRDANIELARTEGPSALADAMAPGFFLPTDPAEPVRRYRAAADAWPLETMIRTLTAVRDRDDTTDLLAAATMPVLIVRGRDDDKVPYLPADNRIGQTIVVDTGHMGTLTHPHTFAGVLMGWLADLALFA